MSQSAAAELADSRKAGDRGEEAVLELDSELESVPDSEAIHYDAIALDAVTPSDRLLFDEGTDVLEADTLIEIKSVSVVVAKSQRPGRFYIRRTQHAVLEEEDAVYVFAVCSPHERELLAALVVSADRVSDLIDEHTDGWRSAGDGRDEYIQLAWTTLLDRDAVADPGGVGQ